MPPWRDWLHEHFAPYTRAPFAPRHISLWDWFDTLSPGYKPRSRVEVWPRGGAKSSSAELGVTRVGDKLTRRFVLYLSATQAQADIHVANIGSMFERLGTERAVNQYGNSKGWRHNELRTSKGFNVVALGLDAAGRGIKLDEFRPDLIILDDIDERHDTEATRSKKIQTVTTSILPSGTNDLAVLVVQNLITAESIVSQLVSEKADFLHDREVATLEPAVRDLEVEHLVTADGGRYRVVGGTATWEGQNLAACEGQINLWGLGAFLREAQHEVDTVDGGLWVMERDIEPFRVPSAPNLVRIVVAIDPNASSNGDEAGIIIGGVDARGHGYLLEDASTAAGPQGWAQDAVEAYQRWEADCMVAEANNGGEMVAITIRTVPGAPIVKLIHASRGKVIRAEPVQKLYQDGRVHHVGRGFTKLERQLCTWVQGMPSPDRMDGAVWCLTELMLGKRARSSYAVSGQRMPAVPAIAGRR